MKKSKRREATSEESARWKKAVAEETRPDVMSANRMQGRAILKRKRNRTQVAREALIALAALRDAQGLSLRELERLTAITSGNLSRLWNDPAPNVTVETLDRIAQALGAHLEIRVTAD